ncbi:CD1845 family protein [Aedoeadaptatus acetigenes]|uniref:CD1845 family protein n=1 Tax=Aedoeadaptatus acetigenes TaxID=2981723 RepID=A0ABV1J470_9FIRM
MRWIIRIILLPIRLVLSLLIAFLTFILSLSTALLSVVSTLIFIIGLASIFQGDNQIVIEALILAFSFSPFGLPKLGIYVIVLLELLNYTIKSI